jgi:hypothetical protein
MHRPRRCFCFFRELAEGIDIRQVRPSKKALVRLNNNPKDSLLDPLEKELWVDRKIAESIVRIIRRSGHCDLAYYARALRQATQCFYAQDGFLSKTPGSKTAQSGSMGRLA